MQSKGKMRSTDNHIAAVQIMTIAETTEENSFAKQMAVLVARLEEQRLILEDLCQKLDAPPEEGLSKKLDALSMKA